MTKFPPVLALCLFGLALAVPTPAMLAQHETAADLLDGERAFRNSCANCHGPDGDLIPGIDLGRGRFRRTMSDADLVRTIRTGIPNTAMPPTPMTDAQAQQIVAYLRSRAATVSGDPPLTGDVARGRAVYDGAGACATCHRINGAGSRVGPELTSIGAVRGAAELQRALLDPQSEVQPQNRSYRVVAADGTAVQGRLLGHDTFSVQLLDSAERLRSFDKSQLRESGFIPSPMPSYRGTLTPQQTADLVSYLGSLRGTQGSATADMAGVTFERILQGGREPHNWLSYSGTLTNHRYSPLTQVTPANVKDLQLKWMWQARSLEKFEATPLVVDGVMYTVEAPNNVVALDAATGRVFWTFNYTPAPEARPCCGRVNRGVSILGNTLYMATIDAHLLAIDATSGQKIWDVVVAKAADRYSMTATPTIVKDKVIVGTGGGDAPIRGFIAAYDARTGQEAWRFYTIPGPGEPGHDTWAGDSWRTGGVGVWNAGAYDPESNLVYFGTGNPQPDWDGSTRAGDNLYSDSVVALDADSGKLKWHYQFTPHDELDYDATQVPVLADINWQGRPRKVMLWANRNGVMYALDRTTGEFLKGKPYVKTNWLDGFDAQGRPNRVKFPTKEGTLIHPHVHGGTNWAPPSFSPRTGWFYVASWENSGSMAVEGQFPKAASANTRQTAMGQTTLVPFFNDDTEPYGVVRAYDPQTLEAKWEYRMDDITWGGTMVTASDLVFSGGREGYVVALDARTGALRWRAPAGGQVNAGAMSYSVNGKQYIAIAAGNSLFAYALP